MSEGLTEDGSKDLAAMTADVLRSKLLKLLRNIIISSRSISHT